MANVRGSECCQSEFIRTQIIEIMRKTWQRLEDVDIFWWCFKNIFYFSGHKTSFSVWEVTLKIRESSCVNWRGGKNVNILATLNQSQYSLKALDIPDYQLYSVSQCSIYAKNLIYDWFYVQLALYLLLQILFWNRPKIQVSYFGDLLTWCEDREDI